MLVLIAFVLKFILKLRFSKNTSIANILCRRYGRSTLVSFRCWERTKIKYHKAVADVKFLQVCRYADLVPIFLRFKLSSKRLHHSSEVQKSRRRLLDVEIKNKERLISQLSEGISHHESLFKSCVRFIDYIRCKSIIDNTVNFCQEKWNSTHDRKITSLRSRSRSEANLLDPESVITNISRYVLSDVEKRALANGLNFTLPPNKLKTGSYLANFEVLYSDISKSSFRGSDEDKLYFQKSLSDIAFSSTFNFNFNRKHLCNIPQEEHDALKRLSKNKDIIITKPDKGSGVVIMNRSDYISKMQEIISDETKFKFASNQDIYKISRTIERRVRNYLRDYVKKPGFISDAEYSTLYPNGSHIGVMYGLPKVHKNNTPMRPICSAVGTATYDLGKYLANIIKPASRCDLGTDLDNTFQFVNQLKSQNVSEMFMVSFDVRSLFTNVPLLKTIDICMDRLYRGNADITPHMPEDVLRRLIKLCVCDNTFVFNNKVYQQIDGVAMGSSLGPVLANIWMAHLEEKFILTSALSPQFYRRYVDDTFCLFKKQADVHLFHDYLNSIDVSTQFDVETESDGQLAFLDTMVSHNDNNHYPDTSTRVKPTDKGLFYNFDSFIPISYKRNLISCLIYRVYHIASSFKIFDIDLFSLENKFIRNGFPLSLIDDATGKFLNNQYSIKDKALTVPKRPVIIILPFLGPISYYVRRKLIRLITRFYPTAAPKIIFKRGLRISNLFSYKDTLPLKCQSGVVYQIKCESCGPSAVYIGKTKNTLHERFYGPNGHLHPSTSSSPLLHHLGLNLNSKCEFNCDNIMILDRCNNDNKLRFMESIYLKFEKQTLNTQERSIPLCVV